MLRVSDLSVRFANGPGVVTAVRNASFSVTEGESLCLLGESGSGKSAAALSIPRLLPASAHISGVVEFRGRNLLKLSDSAMRAVRGREIAVIFEQPSQCLNPVLSVGFQIAEAARAAAGCSNREAWERAIALLARLGIRDSRSAHHYPHEFSGGMQQRVAMAIALAAEPALLIADEPTTALDPTARQQVTALLRESVQRLGMALLLVTHDYASARELCQRGIVVRRGEVVEDGRVNDLFSYPQNEHTRRLLLPVPTRPPLRTASQPLLEARGIAKSYRRGWLHPRVLKVLEAVSFEIGQAETVAVSGDSGSGKTALARCLLRLVVPDSGEITFRGLDWLALSGRDLRRARPKMQIVFQDADGSLSPRRTVRDLLIEPLRLQHISSNEWEGRLERTLATVGLGAELLGRYTRQLSGGQRQRVGIARAIALEPALVILDEPVASLDSLLRRQIFELLIDLQEEKGISYLLISHDREIVSAMAHREFRLENGRTLSLGSTIGLRVRDAEK
jgi:ABC-type glutathione transport system ATPase component